MTATAATVDPWAPWHAAGVLNEAITGLVIATGADHGDDLWLQPGIRTAKGKCRVCRREVPIRVGMNAGQHRSTAQQQNDGAGYHCAGGGQPVLTRAEVTAGQPDAAGSPASSEGPEREVVGGMTLEVVDLDRLVRHPLQPRRDVGDVSELAASIREVGVLQPIVVGPDPAGTQRLRVLFGHRRWAGALRAGRAEVPVLVRWDLGSDAEQLAAMLVENLHRADLSPMEEADGYQQLRLLDVRPAEIARLTGRRRDTVDRRLALAKLPEPVRDRVHAGQVSIGDADALVEFAGDADAAGRLAGLLGTPNFRWELEAERKRRDLRAAIGKRILQAEKAGTVVVRPKTADWRWSAPADGAPVVLDRLDVDERGDHQADPEHGGCPGRALVVWNGDTQAAAACLEASRHGLYTDGTGGAPTTSSTGAGAAGAKEQAAAEAARQQLVDELATAAAVRDEWICHALAAGTRPRRDQQVLMLRQALLYELRVSRGGAADMVGSRAAELLGLEAIERDASTEEILAWGQRLDERLSAAPAERIVQVLWALLLIAEAPPLTRPEGWRDPAAVEFMADLQALGYTPTDVEQRMLADADADTDAAGGRG